MSGEHIVHIRGVLTQAWNAEADEIKRELESCSEMPDYAKVTNRESLMMKRAKLNPKKKKVGIEVVRNAEGMPTTCRKEANICLGVLLER